MRCKHDRRVGDCAVCGYYNYELNPDAKTEGVTLADMIEAEKVYNAPKATFQLPPWEDKPEAPTRWDENVVVVDASTPEKHDAYFAEPPPAQAREFDEKATRKACKALNAIRRDAWVNGVGSAPVQELAFLKGARWQHSQDAARIGLMCERVKLLDKVNDDQELAVKHLEARLAFACERLEVRETELTAAEAERDRYRADAQKPREKYDKGQ